MRFAKAALMVFRPPANGFQAGIGRGFVLCLASKILDSPGLNIDRLDSVRAVSDVEDILVRRSIVITLEEHDTGILRIFPVMSGHEMH